MTIHTDNCAVGCILIVVGIVSSPLTLSHDLTNDTVMDAVWQVAAHYHTTPPALNSLSRTLIGVPKHRAPPRENNVGVPHQCFRADSRLLRGISTEGSATPPSACPLESVGSTQSVSFHADVKCAPYFDGVIAPHFFHAKGQSSPTARPLPSTMGGLAMLASS